jgi:hypothetical protein
MKELPLDFRSFNLTAHQWVLDQYEYFDTIQQGARCRWHPQDARVRFRRSRGRRTRSVHAKVYRDLQDGRGGRETMDQRGTEGSYRHHPCVKRSACIEKEANEQHDVATNMLRQHQHETTSYGINDDSGHWYDEDVYTGTKIVSPGMVSPVTIRNTKHMGCAEPCHLPTADSMRPIETVKEKAERRKEKAIRQGKGYKGKGSWSDRNRKGKGAYQSKQGPERQSRLVRSQWQLRP